MTTQSTAHVKSSRPLITVGYRRGWAITLIVAGGVNLALAALTVNLLTGLAGVLALLIGILQLINPNIVLTADAVLIKSPLGITVKRHPFSDLSRLSFSEDGKQLRIAGPDGSTGTVKIARWLFSTQDLQRLETIVAAGVFG